MRAKFLQVYANPFGFIDADGNPACVVPMEASHGGGARRYVGAHIDMSKSQAPKVAMHRISRGPSKPVAEVAMELVRHPVVFVFDPGIQTVPNSAYYREMVRDGALVAAGPATALLCGVQYIEPTKRLAEVKDKAARDWLALHGEPPPWAPVQPIETAGRQ